MLDRIKATAERADPTSYTHHVELRDHRLTVDEPLEAGGHDRGPTPQELLAASLASCVAMTLEMYAERKGWALGRIAVSAEFDSPERGSPAHFKLELRLPRSCSAEQRERLQVIAGRCPVHRLLAGEVTFEQRITLGEPSGD